MGNGENINGVDAIALFNTFLGLTNMEKNTASQEHSKILEDKMDMVLEKLERLDGLMISKVLLSNVFDEDGALKAKGKEDEDRCMM